MPPTSPGEGTAPSPVPSMLDLVRLSPRLIFPPGGPELYRQIALLTGLEPGHEVLDVACGKGIPLEYLAREYGVHGSGVDPDPRLVQIADDRCRALGIAAQVQFQQGVPVALPYRDEVFDVAVGELGLAARWDAPAAVAELARVTKPGGWVVLAQLAWKAPVDGERQRMLTDHLGARPLLLVEWKRALVEAGVGEIHAEEWSSADGTFRPRGVKAFYDFAEVFTLSEKLGVLRRAWSRWGWTGVRTVLERERAVHQLLTRERILGLYLLKGRKAPVQADAAEPAREAHAGAGPASEPEAAGAPDPPPAPEAVGTPDTDTAGLPLFGSTARPHGDA